MFERSAYYHCTINRKLEEINIVAYQLTFYSFTRVHSRHINSTVLMSPLRSELFYFFQFHPFGNCFVPWPSFWMSNQNEMRKLSWITHRSFPQSPVHFFLWQYEVCLVQKEEQMGDNPLDIPFQIWPHTTNGDSVRLLWSNGLM